MGNFIRVLLKRLLSSGGIENPSRYDEVNTTSLVADFLEHSVIGDRFECSINSEAAAATSLMFAGQYYIGRVSSIN